MASLFNMVRTSVKSVRERREVRAIVGHIYEQHFAEAEHENLFRGVYASFAEAEQSAPRTKPIGYDHPGPAAMYRERLGRVYPSCYPVLYWLQTLMPATRRVFDFGGHVGVHFHAYRKYLAYPPGLRWTVCDVASVVRAGEELARERPSSGLEFTTRFEAADGADVFLASGSLQYVETPLPERLSALASPPQHLILNLFPLHEERSFVTLQNIGSAFCPYAIFRRSELVLAIRDAGYELVDAWLNPEKACPIPAHPEHSVHAYSGFYFRRDAPPDSGFGARA
jgi:putative methyltransferase (TIGR04325 family)